MKKFLTLLLALLMITTVLAGCGGTGGTQPDAGGESKAPGESKPQTTADAGAMTEAPEATTKTDLIVTSYSDPKNLNPFQMEGRQAQRVNFQIFERLIDQGAEAGTFDGMIAESWEFDEDGLGITLKIREGVKFHNGDDLTLEDVRYSLEYAGTQPSSTSGFDWIKFTEAEIIEDSHSIYIPFGYECSLTLSALASNNIYIINKAVFEEYGDEVGQHPVGTGSFRIASPGDWVLDSSLKLTRFDEYWGTKPILETINFKFITENSQAMIELETGSADLVLDVPALSYAAMESNPEFQLIYANPVVGDYVHFNCSRAPFDDVRVRQAVAYAMNQADIRKAVYLDQADILFSAVTPVIFGYSDQFEGDKWPYEYDNANIEKAKELLTEAGYPNGLDVEFVIDDSSDRIAVAEVVKNQLEAAGIRTNLSSMDYAAWNQRLLNGEIDMFLNGINAQTGEPDRAMFLRWHSSCIPDGTNMTQFSNAEFDEVMSAARKTYDDAEKIELYKEAQRIWVEQSPSIPYITRNHIYAAKANLKGLRSYGEACKLSGIYFE